MFLNAPCTASGVAHSRTLMLESRNGAWNFVRIGTKEHMSARSFHMLLLDERPLSTQQESKNPAAQVHA